jgi:hypothetical protein
LTQWRILAGGGPHTLMPIRFIDPDGMYNVDMHNEDLKWGSAVSTSDAYYVNGKRAERPSGDEKKQDNKEEPDDDQRTKVSGYSYSKLEAAWTRVEDGQKLIESNIDCLKDLMGENSCAVRGSEAVNEAGYPIPKKVAGMVGRIRECKSGNFITGAHEFETYLSGIEAPTIVAKNIITPEDVDNLIKQIHQNTSGGRAIMVIKAGNQDFYRASGHVDLLYKDFASDISMYGNYGADLGPYLKRQLASDFSVYIWPISK